MEVLLFICDFISKHYILVSACIDSILMFSRCLFLCSVPKSSVYSFQLSRKIIHLVRTYYFLCGRSDFLEEALSQGEVTSILMAYFAYTKRIDFPFVSKENHFEGTHHDVMNGTIKTLWGFRGRILWA